MLISRPALMTCRKNALDGSGQKAHTTPSRYDVSVPLTTAETRNLGVHEREQTEIKCTVVIVPHDAWHPRADVNQDILTGEVDFTMWPDRPAGTKKEPLRSSRDVAYGTVTRHEARSAITISNAVIMPAPKGMEWTQFQTPIVESINDSLGGTGWEVLGYGRPCALRRRTAGTYSDPTQNRGRRGKGLSDAVVYSIGATREPKKAPIPTSIQVFNHLKGGLVSVQGKGEAPQMRLAGMKVFNLKGEPPAFFPIAVGRELQTEQYRPTAAQMPYYDKCIEVTMGVFDVSEDMVCVETMEKYGRAGIIEPHHPKRGCGKYPCSFLNKDPPPKRGLVDAYLREVEKGKADTQRQIGQKNAEMTMGGVDEVTKRLQHVQHQQAKEDRAAAEAEAEVRKRQEQEDSIQAMAEMDLEGARGGDGEDEVETKRKAVQTAKGRLDEAKEEIERLGADTAKCEQKVAEAKGKGSRFEQAKMEAQQAYDVYQGKCSAAKEYLSGYEVTIMSDVQEMETIVGQKVSDSSDLIGKLTPDQEKKLRDAARERAHGEENQAKATAFDEFEKDEAFYEPRLRAAKETLDAAVGSCNENAKTVATLESIQQQASRKYKEQLEKVRMYEQVWMRLKDEVMPGESTPMAAGGASPQTEGEDDVAKKPGGPPLMVVGSAGAGRRKEQDQALEDAWKITEERRKRAQMLDDYASSSLKQRARWNARAVPEMMEKKRKETETGQSVEKDGGRNKRQIQAAGNEGSSSTATHGLNALGPK